MEVHVIHLSVLFLVPASAALQPLPQTQTAFFDLLPQAFPGDLPESLALDPVAGRLRSACATAKDLARLGIAAAELHSFTTNADGSYDLSLPVFDEALSEEDWWQLRRACETLSQTYAWAVAMAMELITLCPLGLTCTGASVGSLLIRSKLSCQALPVADEAVAGSGSLSEAATVASRALVRARRSMHQWCLFWSACDRTTVLQTPIEDARAAVEQITNEVRIFLDHVFHYMSLGRLGFPAMSPFDELLAHHAPEFYHVPVAGQRWDVLRHLLDGLVARRWDATRGLRVAEIGVEKGMTVTFLMRTVPAITEYVLVDPWYLPDKSQEFNSVLDGYFHNIQAWVANEPSFQRDNSRGARILRMPSEDAAGYFDEGYFDLVFIDAGHTFPEVQRDIAVWKRRLRPDGGILAGHDFSIFHPQVALAVLVGCGPSSDDISHIPLEEVTNDARFAVVGGRPLLRLSADSVWWCVRRETS